MSQLAETLIPQDLAYFALLYEHRSYSAAAKAVPMSYQGFKKAMRLLEKDLGLALFVESPVEGLAPTPYADALYATVREWHADVAKLEQEFEALKTQVKTYRLVAANGTLNHLKPNAVDIFHDERPTLALDVVEYPDTLVDDLLTTGVCDTAVTAAPFCGDFVDHPFFTSRLCFWVPDSHPLAQRDSLAISDLDGQRLSLPDTHYKFSATLASLMEEANVKPRAIAYGNNILSPYAFALAGKGLGVSVQDAESMLGSRPEVHAIPFEGMSYELAFSYRRGYAPTAEDLIVLEFLRESC